MILFITLFIIMIVLLALCFKKNKNKNYIEGFSNDILGKTVNNKYKMVYFYSENCKFCKEFNPIWDQYKDEIKKNINLNEKIEFFKLNIGDDKVRNFLTSSTELDETNLGVPELVIFINRKNPLTNLNDVAKEDIIDNEGNKKGENTAIFSKNFAKRTKANLHLFTHNFTQKQLN